MQVDDDQSVGRWVSGKWSVVGGSVVGGFNKTHSHRQSRNRMMNTFIIVNITPTCER